MGAAFFTYRAHGLSLRSEAELPEATPARFDEPDVVIHYGDAPPALANARDEGAGHQVAPGTYRLEVPEVGVYCLRAGRDLVIAPAPGASPVSVRGPLLSSVMGVAVHERGFFAMHASSVAVDDGCVLFTGVPGAGKSTLAAACHAAEMPVLSDDLVAIEVSERGGPVAHPGYRVVRLWSDALERFGRSLGAGRPLEGWRGKFLAGLPGFAEGTPRPVRAIFDLESPGRCLAMEQLTGTAKVRKIRGRMYRSRMVPALGHADRAFVTATAIARAVPVWSLCIPRNWNALSRAVAEIRGAVAEASS